MRSPLSTSLIVLCLFHEYSIFFRNIHCSSVICLTTSFFLILVITDIKTLKIKIFTNAVFQLPLKLTFFTNFTQNQKNLPER